MRDISVNCVRTPTHTHTERKIAYIIPDNRIKISAEKNDAATDINLKQSHLRPYRLAQCIKYKKVTLYTCDSFYYVVERKRVTGLAWLIGYFGVCSGSPAPGESASNCHVDRLFLTRLIDRRAGSIDWRTLYNARGLRPRYCVADNNSRWYYCHLQLAFPT